MTNTIKMTQVHSKRAIWSWAIYDWANSAFATVIMAGFFPVFFKQFWAAPLPATTSTFWLGMVNSAASLIIVLTAPVLGALADRLNAKKRFLLLFTVLGVFSSAALYWLAQGQWVLALAIYFIGLLGFSGSNIFYDALLVDVSQPHQYERVSSLGYAMGYLGGGVLFAINVVMTLHPDWFGLNDASAAVRWSLFSVAVWWGGFAIPIALWVTEQPNVGISPHQPFATVFFSVLRELWATLQLIRRLPNSFLCLLAYWFYIDGVDTIVRMAVDYGLSLGFAASDLMLSLLITQIIGFPAALLFGHLGEHWGAKNSILLSIAVYLLIVAAASQLQVVMHFYVLAAAIGLVQGGIQALSRALFAHLTPRYQTAQFFGFFNMVGKFAAVLGPALVAMTAALTNDTRLSLLPIAGLFIIGASLLWRVNLTDGKAAIAVLEQQTRST
ncbi:MFS transporter [Rhodoferax sp. 4810]|uniref:MFS transporter n=1 Tax=Thiospirillum jenense TaxID=1653858 RepID=A0A839HH14_9GAMM|nr:MFS transporter [Thiospirillum jenense]MBB1074542.1 MFS transporter [Rhodoferax jenense]MBB1126516.1 MFS transporter [Thiospirillum jenense]